MRRAFSKKTNVPQTVEVRVSEMSDGGWALVLDWLLIIIDGVERE